MNSMNKESFLNEIADKLELPESAYEKSEERYKDIGIWLCRDDSSCQEFSPHIFPQGSFRLGTANKPLNSQEEYDLDLACKLEESISKINYTQADVKELVGKDIELYRISRGINEEIEEKKRCWRLEYADHIKFHMDIVPCIPENEDQREIIRKAILLESKNELLAKSVSDLTVAITDNTHPNYYDLSNNWNISNPEGYAKWFESRIKLAQGLLQKRAELLEFASIDEMPNYKWKTPLQKCVQLLKRHRDIMFKDDLDIKPISIIITTLTARAYQGENDIESTILEVLEQIESLVNSKFPRVPNPVNPSEDFADKWDTNEGRSLGLEENFWNWLQQAQIDFKKMCSSKNTVYLTEKGVEKFAVNLNKSELAEKLGLSLISSNIIVPKHHEITDESKPWLEK